MKGKHAEFLWYQALLCVYCLMALAYALESPHFSESALAGLGIAGLVQFYSGLDSIHMLALVCLVLLVLPLSLRWLPLPAVLFLMVLLELVAVLYLSAASVYFDKTGSRLDLDLVLYGLGNMGGLGALLDGTVDMASRIRFLIPVVLIILSAAAAYVMVQDRFRKRARLFAASLLAIGGLAVSSAVAIAGASAEKMQSSVEPDQPALPGGQFFSPELSVPVQAGRNDVFIIVLESLRADLLGRSSNGRVVVPFLSELSSEFLFFERAYTTISHTSKALVGIHCGMFARLQRPIVEASSEGVMDSCMPRVLAEHGYEAAFVQSADGRFENRRQLVTNLGFSRFISGQELLLKGAKTAGYLASDDAYMIDEARAIIRHRKAPVMLTTLNSLTHHPYVLPGETCTAIKSDGKRDDEKCYFQVASYVDEYVRRMLKMLKEENVYDNALIIVAGDHGEAFGEHGRFQHDDVPYEETTRVPMWIKFPGKPAGVSSRLSQHIDIYPTVMELLGINVGGSLPGKSLYGGGHKEIFTFCWNEKGCMSRVRDNGSKHILDAGMAALLEYDLKKDPQEKKPLQVAYVSGTDNPDAEALLAYREQINSYWMAVKKQQEERRVAAGK
jgi:lipoteichoic acid synthase